MFWSSAQICTVYCVLNQWKINGELKFIKFANKHIHTHSYRMWTNCVCSNENILYFQIKTNVLYDTKPKLLLEAAQCEPIHERHRILCNILAPHSDIQTYMQIKKKNIEIGKKSRFLDANSIFSMSEFFSIYFSREKIYLPIV